MALPPLGHTGFNQVAGAVHARALLHGLTDRATGLHRSVELMEALYSRAQPKAPIVAIDMHNLRQGTEGLGRDLADRFMAICMKVIDEELQKFSPTLSFGLRLHGDEMGVVLDGLSQADAYRAFDAAQKRIEQLTERSGLHLLAHRKQGRKPGLGFDYRVGGVDHDVTAIQILGRLADELQEQKNGHEVSRIQLKGPEDYREGDGRLPVEAAFAATERDLKRIVPLRRVPDAMLDDIGVIHSQMMDDRMRKDSALFNAKGHELLLRLDVRGLGILNSGGAVEKVDALLADFSDKALDVIKTAYPNLAHIELLREDGGIFDVLLPDTNMESRAGIHAQLRHAYKTLAREHGFGKQIDEDQTGLVIFEAGVAKSDPAATIERVQQLKDAYKRAGVDSIIPLEAGGYSVQCANGKCFVLEDANIRDNPHKMLPALHGRLLAEGVISREQMLEILSLPSGMVASQWFGVDIAQAVSANTIIQKLLRAGHLTEAAAVSVTESRDIFLQAISEKRHEYRAISITDAPMLTNGVQDGRLTTLALASRWRLLGTDVSQMILCAQLCSRAVLAVRANKLAEGEAFDKLSKNIKLVIHDGDSRQVQFANALDQAAKIITYSRALTADAVPDVDKEIQEAAFTVLRQTAFEAAKKNSGSQFSKAMLLFTRHVRETNMAEATARIAKALEESHRQVSLKHPDLGQVLATTVSDCQRLIAKTPYGPVYNPAHPIAAITKGYP